jgi:hypothetical protein
MIYYGEPKIRCAEHHEDRRSNWTPPPAVEERAEMSFEEFDRRSRPKRSDPALTIQSKGVFSLNQAAYDALGQPEAVVLLMNQEARVMAFRPATLKETNAYRVRSVPRGHSYVVAGKAFCDRYEISTEKTRAYTAEQQDNLLTVNLQQAEPQK